MKFNKVYALSLSLVMLFGMADVIPDRAVEIQAKSMESHNLSVSAYATKEQLMDDTFAPNSTTGEAENYGRIKFGKKSDGVTSQEWYILGKDNGVSGDNTAIFANSALATEHQFNSNEKDKTYVYEKGTGYDDSADSITVYANHYGASELRETLKNMAKDTTYFTESEQDLMKTTTVSTKDVRNNLYYKTTDTLYALAADNSGPLYKSIKGGSNNDKVLSLRKYWDKSVDEKSIYWLRSPLDKSQNNIAELIVSPGSTVLNLSVGHLFAIQPATNLDMSSVLFASAVTTSDTANSGIIKQDTAMTLRMDGSGKNIGTIFYNTTTGDIKVTKGSTKSIVSLVVQGKDGNNDWYYSKPISETQTVNVGDIEKEKNTPELVELSECKIWLEITDSDEEITYAVEAGKEVETTTDAVTDSEKTEINTTFNHETEQTTKDVSSTLSQATTENGTTYNENKVTTTVNTAIDNKSVKSTDNVKTQHINKMSVKKYKNKQHKKENRIFNKSALKVNDKNEEIPDTGEDAQIVWLFILAIISGTGLLITERAVKKQNREMR